jgi:hypothetical protein
LFLWFVVREHKPNGGESAEEVCDLKADNPTDRGDLSFKNELPEIADSEI